MTTPRHSRFATLAGPLAFAAVGLGIALFCVLAATPTAAGTKLDTVWKDPKFAGAPFKKILVVGLAKEEPTRRTFEDGFMAALSGKGAEAMISYDIIASGTKPGEPGLREKILATGADAVLLVSLAGMDTREVVTAPTAMPTTVMVYDGFYGGYASTYGFVYTPGEIKDNTFVRIDASVFDMGHDAKRVWSAITESKNPKSREKLAEEVIKRVVTELGKAKMIGPAAK